MLTNFDTVWSSQVKIRRLSILLSVLVLVVLFGLATGSAADEGSSEAGQELQNQVGPDIKRLDSFQFLKGERPLRSPLAIVRDPQNGDLIVSSFESGEVIVLDHNGGLLKRLGRQAGLVTPYGVALDRAGRIYVSEVRTGMLKVFAPAGALIDAIDLSALRERKVSPGRISLGPDGQLYIVDLSGNDILVLSDEGTRLQSLGTFGYLQKAGSGPAGEVIGLSGQGKAVTVFDAAGEELRSFGNHGDKTDRNFSFPTGFAIDAKNRLWIADAFQHRIKVFSLTGEFLFNFGKMEEEGGGFFFPVDLCFGELGTLYVLEKGANRIQVFLVEDLDEKSNL